MSTDDPAAHGPRPPADDLTDFTPYRVPPETAKGILRPREQLRAFTHSRLSAGPAVNRYVEWFWAVAWDRRGLPVYNSEILSYPAVNLTFEREPDHTGGFVTGVCTTKYIRELRGEGETFGVKFRAGGFGAFTGMDVGAIRDTAVELTEVLPESVGLCEKVLAAPTLEDRRDIVEDFLADVAQRRAVTDDSAYLLVLRIVAAMERDRELTRVDQVTDRFDIPVRALQRLFRRYVGAGPKWVLRRYRLQDGAYLLAEGRTTDLAALAVDLGYFDQAHFSREFAAEIGMPPLEYARASVASEE